MEYSTCFYCEYKNIFECTLPNEVCDAIKSREKLREKLCKEKEQLENKISRVYGICKDIEKSNNFDMGKINKIIEIIDS